MAKAIAIKIDEESFRDIHVQAAKRRLSIEQYVTGLIQRDLFPERFAGYGAVMTLEQKEQIKAAAQAASDRASQITDIMNEAQRQMDQGGPAMI